MKRLEKTDRGVVFISDFIAHITEKGDIQSVASHLKETAAYAEACLQSHGLQTTAYLAGLLHDMGKYSGKFQTYIRHQNAARRGSVIHTFQGCQFILKNYHQTEDVHEKLAAELIAYAIGAHHGLFDCFDKSRKSGLAYRKEKSKIDYEEATSAFFREVADEREITRLFLTATEEIRRAVDAIDKLFQDDADFHFSIGMLGRLILSSVIEGDRRDTANFMNDAAYPKWPDDMRPIWHEKLEHISEKLSELESEAPIAQARKRISDICADAAEWKPGIYRLNVPTGGGKTLSSLRYALCHAVLHNKKRIVFTAPLLSILEQNAAVIREFLDDDSMVLEHHSNLVLDGLSENELDERELMVQTWDAPVIITTMVQLLNTLFDGKTSSIRRLQSLCDSIIIIDEVQTVPVKMLTLFNLAVQFLSGICGATVVLCSATQPRLEEADHPIRMEMKELVPHDEALWKVFQRTELHPLTARKEEEIPDLVRELMEYTESLLVVCNKKSEAAKLTRQLKDCGWQIFHLSAAMCVQHRRDTVNALKEALNSKRKTVCISTQVIEAGVDISFQTVLRYAAGMDSVIQAAGRCNRNGESEQRGSVYLVNVSDEALGRLPEILRGKTASIAVLDQFERAPQQFQNDLASENAIRLFYERYYHDMNEEAQDYPLSDLKTSVFDLLSQNTKYVKEEADWEESYMLPQAFKTAGQRFEVFDSCSTDVLVPYGNGKEVIAELCSYKAETDVKYRTELLRAARPYTVSIYDYQLQKLSQNHAVCQVCKDYVLALAEQNYDSVLGLIVDEPNAQNFLEV